MKKAVLWPALTAFLITWAASTLWWPFGPDQGIFAWVGDVILQGGMPYRDAWEVKGPVVHYAYALSQLLFGRVMWGIRLLDLAVLALALPFLWRMAARLFDETAAKLAVVLFTLWYANGGYWSTSQPDGWAAMLLIIAVYHLLNNSDSVTAALSTSKIEEPAGPRAARLGAKTRLTPQKLDMLMLAAGAIIGLCSLIKPIYATYLLLFVIYALAHPTAHPARVRFIRSVGLGLLSWGLIILLMVAWFAYRGALADLIEVQITFNSTVHRLAHTRTTPAQLQLILGFALQGWILVALLPAVVGGMSLWQRRRPEAGVLGAWMLLTLLLVMMQNKFYLYHWFPLYGPLAIIAGGGVSRLLAVQNLPAVREMPGLKYLSPALLALMFSTAMIVPTLSLLRWGLAINGYQSWESYYQGFGTYGEGDFSFKADQEVAQFISQQTSPQDTVLVWGFEVLVNYLSGRPSPSRFGFNYALVRGSENMLEPAYRAEFMQALYSNPPRYILILDEDKNDLMAKTSRQFVNDFPALKTFIDTHYQLETTIEHFAVWQYRPAAVEKAAR